MSAVASKHATIGEVLLRGQNITRRWGGLVALNQVNVELTRGSVHAAHVLGGCLSPHQDAGAALKTIARQSTAPWSTDKV